MRPPVAASSAYWFCCVMDVLSAISLPAAPSDRKGGWYWGDKEVGGQGSASGMLWPEKERWSRSISANINPLHNDNSVATFTLQHIDMYQQQPPRSCDPNDPIVIQKYHFDRKYLLGPFKDQVAKAVQLANVLNNLFLYNHRSDDLYKNTTYFALTQTLVDSDPKVKGCGIVFDVGQYPSTPHIASKSKFFPYSYRATKGATIVSELSSLYEPFNSTFFVNQKSKDPAKLVKNTPIASENSDLVRLGLEIKYQWNHTITVTESDGYWAQPYYDCFLNSWILQFSVPFYEVKSNGSAVFKGVVLLDVDLSALDIDQCGKDSTSLFSGTHRCRQESTTCIHTAGNGFRWGDYKCVCSPEFYFPDSNATEKSFSGREVEMAYLNLITNKSFNYSEGFMCLPCRKGCERCDGNDPCIVEYDILLRGIPLGIQSFCMTIALVIGFVIIRLRKTKVMRASIWGLLEMVLLGALLLYATVVIQYFEPTATNCLLVPWFREVGFAILYGTLVLKIYRILAEFQSRKAHRVHVRDKDLLKSLAVILVVVIGYMAAWTAVNADHLTHAQGATLLEKAVTTNTRLSYVLCRSLWWDYVIEIGEVVFLCVGVYMCYCVRAAPSDFYEGRFVSVAICYELFISTIFYIMKHLWLYTLHPDYLFLVCFLRCQLTVTVNLLILLGPKLWYAHRPPDDDRMRTRAYSQSDVQDSNAPETMKLNVGISSNGDVDVGEISLTEMDPEDIRAELKRLYTQLQIYKTKTMRKDNPHISKRRGGRKQTHRRFSLQAFHHKHRHHHEPQDHEHEMSKTPEESTNSAEAMTFTMEPSVKEDPNEGSTPGSGTGSVGRNLPSVSFKPGHT